MRGGGCVSATRGRSGHSAWKGPPALSELGLQQNEDPVWWRNESSFWELEPEPERPQDSP